MGFVILCNLENHCVYLDEWSVYLDSHSVYLECHSFNLKVSSPQNENVFHPLIKNIRSGYNSFKNICSF